MVVQISSQFFSCTWDLCLLVFTSKVAEDSHGESKVVRKKIHDDTVDASEFPVKTHLGWCKTP